MMDILLATMGSILSLGLISIWNKDLFSSTSLPLTWVTGAVMASTISFYFCRTYLAIIRHASLREVGSLFGAVFIKELCLGLLFITIPWLENLRVLPPQTIVLLFFVDTLLTFVGVIGARVVMILIYNQLRRHLWGDDHRIRTLIYGTGNKSVAMIKRLATSPHYNVIGFIARGQANQKQLIGGLKVYYFDSPDDLHRINLGRMVQAILFAKEEDARSEQDRELFNECLKRGTKLMMAPSIDEVVGGRFMRNQVREIKIEDLLGRSEIEIGVDEVKNDFEGKTVLVTGAAGSIGSELCRQLSTFGLKRLVLFDNAETPTHNIRLELEERFPDLDFVPVIGDVRQLDRVRWAFDKYQPQVVFHAAAYKHVPLMEENPCEAVFVNVNGSRNVADECLRHNVEKMVMISTDKAVNPTNIMGCTKRLAEIYVQSLGIALEKGELEGRTRFVTTRFGNVLGSNGSVIPRFREQIVKGGPVTVTHPDITRFFMTIPEACRLVMEAAVMSTGTQIFVFDMGRSMKIANLARRMIELAGLTPDVDIKIEYTGLRPGEKLYEEVLSSAENTLPTEHSRIRIARVREYSYDDARRAVEALSALAAKVDVDDMVRMMKVTVPEFKSKNSRFEVFDRELAAINNVH